MPGFAFRGPLRLKSRVSFILLCFVALSVAGCGGGSNSQQTPPPTGTTPLLQLTAISVAPPDSSAPMGMTQQFIGTGSFSDGSKQDISSEVTWSSANAGTASISNNPGSVGMATAVSPGSTTITASLAAYPHRPV